MEKPIKSPRILLVDDDPITNMIHTKLISRESGSEIGACTDGQAALNYLVDRMSASPEKLPNVLLLDINMPVMDGWEFLEEFEKLPDKVKNGCRVVMLTSSIDRDDYEKSKLFPSVKDFVSKPLTRDKVRELLGNLTASEG